ncbi:MAG: hypothetical protein WEH44_03465, partial [Pirellulaceae bacterium]
MLQDAKAAGDLSKIVQVATRFFHTDAGYEAANHLAAFHFDRVEFALAVRWYGRLVAAQAPITKDPLWRMKAAFALHRGGRTDEAVELMKTLPSDVAAKLNLAGESIDPQTWLSHSGAIAVAQEPVLDDWPLFLGSPSRSGIVRGGEPLLLPRWSLPLTDTQSIRRQLDVLVQDLADQGRVGVPAWFPLMVDNKVIFRTMRGVQVVDARTGKSLWEAEERIAAEQLLSGEVSTGLHETRQRQVMWFRGGMVQEYGDNDDASQPLINLLYRNGAYGILSSDGDQLFVLEEQALATDPYASARMDNEGSESDPLRRDWSSNRIAAYDLATGRPLW